MKNGKFLAGVMAGMGAGALLGILFAPGKGSATRKKLFGQAGGPATEAGDIHEVMKRNKQKLQQQAEERDLHGSVN